MEAEIIIIAGFATFFNVAIIYWKIQKGQGSNAALDGAILAGVMWLFHGSLGALVIGTIASSLFSLFLVINPPKEDFFSDF